MPVLKQKSTLARFGGSADSRQKTLLTDGHQRV